MKRIITQAAASSSLAILLVASTGGLASAANKTVAATTSGTSAASQQHLQTIISKGDQEISRRLATLGTLASKINAAAKLSASDKSALSSEVTNETSGLTALKSKLDADTTVDSARADAQSIVNDYRVYALIVPKIELVKVADDQQVTESKLSNLATKLQARITKMQSSGKDVSALEASLSDMTAKTQAAQGISSGIESKVVSLQPSDYDTNHTVLSGDSAQLKSAHADNQAAAADAKTIIAGLK